MSVGGGRQRGRVLLKGRGGIYFVMINLRVLCYPMVFRVQSGPVIRK